MIVGHSPLLSLLSSRYRHVTEFAVSLVCHIVYARPSMYCIHWTRQGSCGEQSASSFLDNLRINLSTVYLRIERLEDLAKDAFVTRCRTGLGDGFPQSALDLGLREQGRKEGLQDTRFFPFLLRELWATRLLVLGGRIRLRYRIKTASVSDSKSVLRSALTRRETAFLMMLVIADDASGDGCALSAL